MKETIGVIKQDGELICECPFCKAQVSLHGVKRSSFDRTERCLECNSEFVVVSFYASIDDAEDLDEGSE